MAEVVYFLFRVGCGLLLVVVVGLRVVVVDFLVVVVLVVVVVVVVVLLVVVLKPDFLVVSSGFHFEPGYLSSEDDLMLNFGFFRPDTIVGRNGLNVVVNVDFLFPDEKGFEFSVTGYLFSAANLLYVSAAFGCHCGLHVVMEGAVVGGSLFDVTVVVLDVVGLTLYIGNFLVGNI